MKHVVVAGGTGLVGGALLAELAARRDVRTSALVRREGALPPGPHREVVFEFANPEHRARLGAEIPCDVLVITVGTTIRKAGSAAAFRAVDLDVPLALIDALKQLPVKPGVALVSSVGAGRPAGLYLETKHAVEQALIASGLPYAIFRPSVLDGNRAESRPLEHLALAVGRPLVGALRAVFGRARPLGLYAPIPIAQVARAIVRHAIERPPANEIVEGWALYDPA
jgi:uncharacterized protein YbjT (DUF2867 family)